MDVPDWVLRMEEKKVQIPEAKKYATLQTLYPWSASATCIPEPPMWSKCLVPREGSCHVVSNIIWGKRDDFAPLPPSWPSLSFIALLFLLSQPLGSPRLSLNKCYRNAHIEVKKIQSLLSWNDCSFTVFLVLNLAVTSGHNQTLFEDMDRIFLRSQRFESRRWTCQLHSLCPLIMLYFADPSVRFT